LYQLFMYVQRREKTGFFFDDPECFYPRA